LFQGEKRHTAEELAHCKHDLTGEPEKFRRAKITIYAKSIFQNKNKQKKVFCLFIHEKDEKHERHEKEKNVCNKAFLK